MIVGASGTLSGFPAPGSNVLSSPAQLKQRIDECLIADRHRLRRQLQSAERARDEPRMVALAQRITASAACAAARKAQQPAPEFPAELPISARLDEIRKAVSKHQVIILCGETGSGKSTQLPKLCLTMGRGVFGRIGHTQPRRIAARSLAHRVASELGQKVGQSVGYKVRFHDRVGEHSHIKLMTDGILLAEIQQDRFLNEYDTLIIDEAHERSLNIDFLLGYLKQLLPRRRDLKVIITSATIDPGRFSRHFDNAPILEVTGRTYPVEVHYRPPEDEGASERDEPFQEAIVDAVDELGRIGHGDILVFLSGEREIRETAETLSKHRLQATEILPLYARQGSGDQAKIFKPSGQRRIVLATNVAETSLTVPGIRYVIDAGFARISRYSHRSKIQRLPVERISKASADQRKGRCGRIAAGVCVRLYAEDDLEGRRDFTEPEILRTNLAAVILQMKLLGFGEIEDFPFVEPPDSRQIKDGYRVLEEIGAVDGLRKITQLGRKLARLPVDPRIGRMLLEAAHTHCLREVLVIASALSVQDPRDRPLDKRQLADEAHAEFNDEHSDFMGYLKLWTLLEEQRRHLTNRKFRELCRQRFLSWTRVQEWHDTHRQLRAQLHELGYRDNEVDPGYESIHKAVLAGLLSHVGFKSSGQDRDYLGARNTRFMIFPGSGLFEKPPKWVVAAELVETTRLYARSVARIQPEWLESLAGHLVKRSYSEPHWQGRRGQAGAYEKVTLFGLTIVPRRRVNYGPIDPVLSRELFLRHGLVDGDFDTRARFWRHNRELVEEVRALEAKSRRRDILVDEDAIYAFYDRRVPEGIYSKPQFEQWLRQATKSQPRLLHLRLPDLLRRDAEDVTEALYPDALAIGQMRLPLEYHFAPGEEQDGVTLVVPAMVLRQITEGRADWLVPGLLREKVIAMLKSLPKALRRHFVPVPDFADQCLALIEPGETPLVQALGAALKRLTDIHVPETAWDLDGLPEHLRLRVRVVDAGGQTLGVGRQLHSLRERYADLAAGAVNRSPVAGLERSGLTDWDVADIPQTVETDSGGIQLQGFPALVDCGDHVDLRVLDAEPVARSAHEAGVRRLFMLKLPREVRYLRRNLPNLQAMRLQYAKAQSASGDAENPGDLEDELVALTVHLTFIEGRPEIRQRAEFEARIAGCKAELMIRAVAVCERIAEILTRYHQVRKQLSAITQLNWLKTVHDAREQLDHLVYRGFLQATPWSQLQQYPRYLHALALRLEKLPHAAARDQQRVAEFSPLWQDWLAREKAAQERGMADPRLEEIRWMLEELRVSLFAQELGTAYPVSAKRVGKRWRDLGL